VIRADKKRITSTKLTKFGSGNCVYIRRIPDEARQVLLEHRCPTHVIAQTNAGVAGWTLRQMGKEIHFQDCHHTSSQTLPLMPVRDWRDAHFASLINHAGKTSPASGGH
jgi:hypothetical protein